MFYFNIFCQFTFHGFSYNFVNNCSISRWWRRRPSICRAGDDKMWTDNKKSQHGLYGGKRTLIQTKLTLRQSRERDINLSQWHMPKLQLGPSVPPPEPLAPLRFDLT